MLGMFFVPIHADDVVIMCEFCRSEFHIWKSIVIDIDARYFVSLIFIAAERNLCCTRFCLTLIRDIFVLNRIPDLKIDFVLRCYTVLLILHVQVLRTEVLL